MKPPRFSLWLFLLIAFFVVLLVSPDSDAGGYDRAEASSEAVSKSVSGAEITSTVNAGSTISTGGNTLTGGTVTGTTTMQGGDVNVGSSRAYALSNSLGDVDIAGCLGSTQWNTPLFGKQKLVINWPCLAEFYLRNGLYDNAAMAICNTEVRQEFESEEECRAAHPFKAMAVSAPMPTESDEEDEDHDRLQAEIAALRADLSAFQEQKAQALARVQKVEETAQRAYRRPQTVIQRESFIDEDKRAALEALKGEK